MMLICCYLLMKFMNIQKVNFLNPAKGLITKSNPHGTTE